MLLLLGRPRLVAASPATDTRHEHVFPADKRHQLLAYLAYQGEWVERTRLAALWWPEADDAGSLQNLRQLLRRAKALHWTSAAAGGLELDVHRARWLAPTDLAALRGALAAGDGAGVQRLYRGPLMQGLEGYEDNEFGLWLEVEREQLYTAVRQSLVAHAESAIADGRLAEAAATTERLVELDPFDEDAVARRMALGLESGSPAIALSHYQQFAKRLEREFALVPSLATVELAGRLEASASRAVGVVSSAQVAPETEATQPREPLPVTDLPTAGTTFVGRDLELSEIAARLEPADGRLVTLIGPSGIGKTRLAVEAARCLAGAYRDGAAFVPLTPVRSAEGLVRALSAALGLTLGGTGDGVDDLCMAVATRRQLVVLDNFEQLVAAGSAVVATMVARAPGLDFIVTSHERLGLGAEWVIRVDGLARGDDVATSDAAALFADRARRVRHDFGSQQDMQAVATICSAVHGSPLGIELAAAWTRVLSAGAIAAEIATAPDFLTSNAPDVPERHRSMRAAFSYSWSLLTDAEREVLPRLAVFRGSFSREAAAVVAGVNLALLTAFVDKALVRVAGDRLDVHPVLHGFLGEALAALPGEPARSRQRLSRFMLALVEQADGRAPGPAQVAWIRRLDVERPNLAEAFAWAVEARDADLGLRLAGPLLRFWLGRGLLGEGREFVERVLAIGDDLPPSLALATALNTAGGLALNLADYGAAEAYYVRSREVARSIDHQSAIARVAIGAGLAASRRGDMESARSHYLEGLELQRRLGNREAATGILNNLGVLALDLGDVEEAVSWLEQAVTAANEVGDPLYQGSSLNNLGWAAWLRGDVREARERLQQGLARCREANDAQGSATALNNLALVHLRCGDAGAALASATEALALRSQAGDRWGLTYSWDVLAVLAAERGEDEVAVWLWSAAAGLRSSIGSPLQPGWLTWQEEVRGSVLRRLGEQVHARAVEAGRALDVEAVNELARSQRRA